MRQDGAETSHRSGLGHDGEVTARDIAHRIDAHHHMWDLAVRDQEWTADFPVLQRSYRLDDLRPELAGVGMGRSIVVQALAAHDETAELLAVASGIGSDVIVGVVGWVDLTAPSVADDVAAVREAAGGNKLVGIRHLVQTEPDPRWLCRAGVRRSLGAVADADLVYDLLVRPLQLPAAIETVRSLPQLRFVLDHAGKPPIASGALEPWRSEMSSLASFPNVAVKLSGLVTEADLDAWRIKDLQPYADAVLEAFGPERTMYGSDWPVCLLAASYTDVFEATDQLTSQLSASERQAVFGATAADWYGLDADDTH